MKRNLLVATLGALAVVGLGCGGEEDGTLHQNWTIQGTTNPSGCSVTGANQMRVVVINSDGVAQATNFVPCGAFTTSFALHPNTYTAAATFLGTNGLAVSQTKLVPAFTISENETTTRTIDFALNDFLPR